jgi:glyoxylase-like metal-dependent hydrolase (beta-lactamase superfamily II)
MRRTWCLAAGLAAAAGLASASAARPAVQLWRLDCGRFVEKGLVDSCYLVRDGNRYALWDAGLDGALAGLGPHRVSGNLVALDAALTTQLAAIGVRPEQIDIVALSHGHFDHVGQAASFPRARLTIGRADWEALAGAPAAGSGPLAPWIAGAAPVDRVDGDRDLFGDGRVVMIATPGHTPGHHVLLVRLRRSGPVLLTGDLWSRRQQRKEKAVSPHNPDPLATRASYAKVERLARRLRARIVIGHDSADVATLPAFPAGAD